MPWSGARPLSGALVDRNGRGGRLCVWGGDPMERFVRNAFDVGSISP